MSAALRVIVLVALSVFSGHGDSSSPAVNYTCGDNVVLRCGAIRIDGVRYRDVRWYKVAEGPQPSRTGLLRKNLQGNSTRWYGSLTRPVAFHGDSVDLVLPNATANDSGIYSCSLSAPVGQKNREGFVHLKVSGCREESASEDLWFEIILFLAVVLSLVICFICWVCLRNLSILRETRKQSSNAKKTLQLIYSPGLKGPTYHHVCV